MAGRDRSEMRRALAPLLLVSLGLSSCGGSGPAGPAYCVYGKMVGAMCDVAPDPSTHPYRLELGLRSLAILPPADRLLVERHAAALAPRPGAIRVLAPVSAPPPDRAPLMPGPPFSQHVADARLLVVAIGDDRVELHALMLGRDVVLRDQLLARGLRAGRIRGAADRGAYLGGFSLTDREDGVGDLFVRAGAYSRYDYDHPERAGMALFRRIAAESEERRRRFFETIYEPGSCGPDPDTVLLLAPPPDAWLDEYRRSCARLPNDLSLYVRLPAPLP